MCQPGRPLPHGLSHAGSPGLAAFHSAKSSGLRLRSSTSIRARLHLLHAAPRQLAVFGELVDLKVDIAVHHIGVAIVHQSLQLSDDGVHVLETFTNRGRRTPSASASSIYIWLYLRATSVVGMPSSWARRMILSSMSVKFCTKST